MKGKSFFYKLSDKGDMKMKLVSDQFTINGKKYRIVDYVQSKADIQKWRSALQKIETKLREKGNNL